MSARRRPRIAISMGDPAGVGPELCCRVATDPAVLERCDPVILGNPAILAAVAERCDLQVPECLAVTALAPKAVAIGTVAAAHGAAALAAVEAGIDGCLSGQFTGLVTAPINKQAIEAAGCPFPGHTELLADHCAARDIGMLLTDGTLSVALVTIHQSLASAIKAITTAEIIRISRLLDRTLRQLHGRQPRLAILGLNPHAGEGGRFGSEENTLIAPAISALRDLGLDVDGPLPPDTAFTPRARERYDGHVCMYHDQGLIPFKTIAFDTGVNVTMGLPIIRTSPDHGTAFDIAWQGVADPTSMRSAVLMACELL